MRSDHDSRGERISLRNGGSAATWYLEEPPERRQEPRREVGTSEFSRNCQVGCPKCPGPCLSDPIKGEHRNVIKAE